jgi:hypothetical protein
VGVRLAGSQTLGPGVVLLTYAGGEAHSWLLGNSNLPRPTTVDGPRIVAWAVAGTTAAPVRSGIRTTTDDGTRRVASG